MSTIVCWSLVGWAGGEFDSVTWIPERLDEVPERCICGHQFDEHPPEPVLLACSGPWRHVWRPTSAVIDEAIERRSREGQP